MYDIRDADEEFAELWADADDMARDKIRAELRRRAIEGIDKPITVAGEREVVKEYSDRLLERMASANLPEYREKVDHSHRVDLTVQHEHTLEQAREVYAELAAIGVLARPPDLELEPESVDDVVSARADGEAEGGAGS